MRVRTKIICHRTNWNMLWIAYKFVRSMTKSKPSVFVTYSNDMTKHSESIFVSYMSRHHPPFFPYKERAKMTQIVFVRRWLSTVVTRRRSCSTHGILNPLVVSASSMELGWTKLCSSFSLRCLVVCRLLSCCALRSVENSTRLSVQTSCIWQRCCNTKWCENIVSSSDIFSVAKAQSVASSRKASLTAILAH